MCSLMMIDRSKHVGAFKCFNVCFRIIHYILVHLLVLFIANTKFRLCERLIFNWIKHGYSISLKKCHVAHVMFFLWDEYTVYSYGRQACDHKLSLHGHAFYCDLRE
jgi:hypothetical protein